MKRALTKIRAAARRGEAQHKDSLKKARVAAEEKKAKAERADAEKLKKDRKTCEEWIENTLPGLVEQWAGVGRRKIKFYDLNVGICNEALIAACLQDAGLEIDIDKRYIEESRDPDFRYDAHWDTTYHLVLP